MRVTVTVVTEPGGPGGQTRDLAQWLGRQPELRNRYQLVDGHGRSSGSALGNALTTIVADLGPAGLGSLAGVLVTWLRSRTSNVRIVVRRADGARSELSSQRVRRLGSTDLRALVDQLAGTAGTPSAERSGAPAAAPGQLPAPGPLGAATGDGAQPG